MEKQSGVNPQGATEPTYFDPKDASPMDVQSSIERCACSICVATAEVQRRIANVASARFGDAVFVVICISVLWARAGLPLWQLLAVFALCSIVNICLYEKGEGK